MLRISNSLIAALILSGAAVAQRTWVVDQFLRPGYDFVTIDAAVFAARPGDTVVVRRGVYQGFRVSKGIRIVGDGQAIVATHRRGPSPIVVSKIPAGQSLVLSRLSTTSFSSIQTVGQILITDCSGTVSLEEVRCYGPTSPLQTAGPHAVDAKNCKALVINRSILGFGLRAVDSKISANDTIFRRYDAVSNRSLSPSIQLSGSNAQFVNCVSVGETSASPALASAALNASGTTVDLRGSSNFIAGDAPGAGSSALVGDAKSSLLLDPRVALRPSGTRPAIQGFGSIQRKTLPTLTVHGGDLGQWIDLRVKSSASHLYILKLGAPTPPIRLAPFGDKWTDSRSSHIVWAVVLDKTGGAETRLRVPSDPRLRGLVVGWQGLAGAWPQLAYSNPAITTLR